MDGVVRGVPGFLVRLEGALVCALTVAAYAQAGSGWGLFAALILAPDLSMLGYLAGPRWGARAYNAAHTYLAPAALGVAGVVLGHHLLLALGLIWAAHISADRALGYGLKYPDAFKHTHLSGTGQGG
jgi:hypothetical protein